MTANVPTMSAAAELGAQLSPDRVLAAGGYEQARRIWNGAVTHRPALIVRPKTTAEVQTAVLAARRHELPMSVRGGGHDWAGRALRDGGLVIDMSLLRRVVVDQESRTAIALGGATAGDLIAAAAPHRLAAAVGTTGEVGLAGLTLGGGYGPLNGRFGLALDNLLSAEVVLADGQRVTTDCTHEPELFWALRGGGGNFGVVTSLSVRLHPVDDVLAGLILYPWSQAAQVWRGLDAVLTGAPDEFTVQSGMLHSPDGDPMLFLSPVWVGDHAPGQEAIDSLLRLGTPLISQVAPMTYADMLGMFDAHVVNGRHYAVRTRSVASYTPDVIAALTESGMAPTSALSVLAVHHFHGASTRVASGATAFSNRRNHFLIEIVAAWEPQDTDGARHRAWADSLSSALAPHALPGGYPNLLGPDDHEQTAHAYGENATRLLAAKNRFDPDGIFTGICLPTNNIDR
jgi:FAD binding domain